MEPSLGKAVPQGNVSKAPDFLILSGANLLEKNEIKGTRR